ncbi:MAG TPA: beta-galactosidase [Ktedonobacteraceae bacterium]|nr:beta-galactosidase [Ktedonobacteraceae bacterium]
MSLHRRNILVFSDSQYPQYCSETTLHELVPGSFDIADSTHLAESLEQEYSLLVSFHGAYFPKSAWNAILRFLESGKNLAVFGGMPFACPVTSDGQVEPEQDVYTRQIYLGPFFQVAGDTASLRFVADEEAILLRGASLQQASEVSGTFWSFYPKLTQVDDHPEDMGSAGPIDTLLRPLIYAVDTDPATGKPRRIATPASLLEQRSGRFRGGRWLLSPWLPTSEADWLANAGAFSQLLQLTARGANTLDVRPALGCYRPGEAPSLIVSARTQEELHAFVSVYGPDSSRMLQRFEITFSSSSIQQEQTYTLPVQQRPGLYTLEVEYQSNEGQPLALKSGFWIWDQALVEATRKERLSAGRDYFYQQERLFLIFGTTYMDSQVQRKFLYLPNPARWDKDFAEMRAAGVNTLRTGIWTAWREFVSLAGVAHEAFLRAMDAFVMTACKHTMQIIFTFFSFSPPLFEGENPWLDPRSVEAQQDFVALLARRYAHVELLSWDLINEPSFGDPKRVFAARPLPNNDRFEQQAFRQWLQKRFTLDELQLRWRQTPADLPSWEQVFPPLERDYDADIRNTTVRAMLKVADYTLFSQDMFSSWASKMLEAIRAGGSSTLVGVGQDESGTRIAPQFYARAVDYTTTHPWWNIDDLLWDMLLDKTISKPNLIQETGVMQLRDIDGRPWRTEQANAYLLQRKLITGLAARGAGLIQWLWHINSYMTSDNENSIGLVRPDGSVKPELAVMEDFGRLVQAMNGRLIEEPSVPAVWLVVPYSQWFVRPSLARAATQRAVRILGYDLNVLPQLIGEHELDILNDEPYSQPHLIIVPALQLLDQQAWQTLLSYVHNGGTLLVSGVITRDQHNLPFDPGVPGVNAVSGKAVPIPVSRYEELELTSGQISRLTFDNEKLSYVRKAHNRVYRVDYGRGTLIWCGLPMELACEENEIRALYAEALGRSVDIQCKSKPFLVSRKPLKDGTLFLVVSESSRSQDVELSEGLSLIIEPEQAGAALLSTDGTMQTFGGLHVRDGKTPAEA